MGSDAKTSVSNRWNQTWDVKNLFLCDGAPFLIVMATELRAVA